MHLSYFPLGLSALVKGGSAGTLRRIGGFGALLVNLLLAWQSASAQTARQGEFMQHAVVNVAELAAREALAPAAAIPAIARVAPPWRTWSSVVAPPTTTPSPSVLSRGVALQGRRALQSPPPSVSFQGAPDNGLSIPPDTMGAVGPNHLVVALNGTFRVQSRTGQVLSTITLDAFWSGVGPFAQGTFDPKVYYEPFVNRWVIVTCADGQLASSAVLIGVSQTSDPTGGWNTYRVAADPTGQVWADYPSVGFNKDWVVVTLNMFDIAGAGAFNREHIYIFNKANLIAGGPSATHTLLTDPGAFTLVPAVTYDTNLATIYLLNNVNGNAARGGTLRLYNITGQIGSESLNVVGDIASPARWDDTPSTGNGDFCPQPGPAKIQANDSRLQNVVYRNGSLWTTHTVFLPVNSGSRASVQWWQINPAGTIMQRGLIDNLSGFFYYTMPSIAVNKNDDAMIGYSTFAPFFPPTASYSFRAGTDPLNLLQFGINYRPGRGPYFKTFGGGANRWGDYSATVVDPVNDLDMWTLQEYADIPAGNPFTDGSGRWGVWWAQLSRALPPDGILEVAISPVSGSVLQAGSNYTFTVTINDTFPVTNATVLATMAGVFTNQFFINDGTPPDRTAGDNVYSFLIPLPTFNTNVTLDLLISAPGKTNSTNSAFYFVANPPINDYFASAIKIPDPGGIVLGDNTFSTLEPGEPLHGGVPTMTNSVWWYWAPTNSGTALIDPVGSGFNTIIAVYTNLTLNTLGLVAAVDDVGLKSRGYVTFPVTAGQTYRIAVAGYGPLDFGPIRLRVGVDAQPDTIGPVVAITAPLNGIITTNGFLIVSGTVTELRPDDSGVTQVLVSVNNNPPIIATVTNIIATASNAVVTLTNCIWFAPVQLTPGTNNIQVVAIDLAENSSTPVAINVNYRYFDPLNDIFANALPLPGTNGLVMTNTFRATFENGEPLHAGKQGGKSVWWFFTAPTNGTIFLSTTNSDFDTLMGVYIGTRVSALTVVAANDDAGPGLTHSEVTIAVTVGQTYYVAVDGLGGASGMAFLQYQFTPTPVFTLSLSTPGGNVNPGAGSYASNSVLSLLAVPLPNFDFVSWQGDALTTDNPLSLTITRNTSLTALFLPRSFADDFETGGLTKLPWTGLGNVLWSVQVTNAAQTNTPFGGRFFARSGAIGNSQSSSLKLTAGMYAGPATFSYRVSTEAGYDFFDFFINGTNKLHQSGETGWINYQFNLNAGTNTLEWRFTKDPSSSGNLDAVFLDNVDLPVLLAKDASSPATFSTVRLATDGNTQFRIAGQTNQLYFIQASVDLFNWQTIATNVARHGLIQFTDAQGTNLMLRYYRVVVP